MTLCIACRVFAVSAVAGCLFAPCPAADEPVIAPPLRLDPDSGDDRFALEFSAIARGTDVVAAWMKRPQDFVGQPTPHMQRRAFSRDGGTTWVLENVHAPNSGSGTPETDPMTAYDPRTGIIWCGAKRGQRGLFFAPWEPDDPSFGPVFDAYMRPANATGNVDKCWAAAGPRPGDANSTRIYIASTLPLHSGQTGSNDIIWSDDLGATWSDPPLDIGNLGFKLPRIGSAGELYIASFVINDLKLDRSNALVDPQDPSSAPLMKQQATVATVQTGHSKAWYPSNFDVNRFAFIAVDPIDPEKVYCVWQDKTSVSGGNTNVDLYFRIATDAMNNDDPPNLGLTTTRIIPNNQEVEGDQFFPWIEATRVSAPTGDFTRLHLVYMDSRNTDQDDSSSNPDGFFDLYYAFSDDEGVTWTEHRLTPESFNAGLGVRTVGGRLFFGDYIALAAAGKRIYCFYAAIDGEPPRAEAFCSVIVFGAPGVPDSFTVVQGSVQGSNDVQLLRVSDDAALVVRAPPSPGGLPLRTIVDVVFTSSNTGTDELDIRVETQSSIADTTCLVSIRNWDADSFDLLGVFPVSTTEDRNFWSRAIPHAGTLNGGTFDYVRNSDGRVELRLEQTAPAGGGTLDSMYDFVQVTGVKD